MNIPPSKLTKWRSYFEHGDFKRISKASVTEKKPKGIDRKTIRLAIRTGVMNEQTFEAIELFYKEKEERQRKLVA